VHVPEGVVRKAVAVGAEGERWLLELGRVVADLEAEWGLRVGRAITGGSGGFVANAVMADGSDAVLKIAIPDGLEGHCPFERELQTLLLGDGQGYARVVRADVDRRAMLQERLGRPLSDLALPVDAQIVIIASTLRAAWRTLPADTTPPLPTGAQQAHGLIEFIETRWEELAQPCPRRTVDCATAFARSRRDSFDPATAVMVHGDAHPANILEDTSAAPGANAFKLIDPDGMLSEPAHDLAIPLRDWTDELLATDPVEQGLSWCSRLAERTGADPAAIWEWAFVERVSTGLFLLQLGDPFGARFLEVAARWT
jgi:streptomycin 6-kinase